MDLNAIVTVQNYSKDSIRTSVKGVKQEVKKGEKFETTLRDAEQKIKMYPKIFKMIGGTQSQKSFEAELKAKEEEAEIKTAELAHKIYDNLKIVIPTISLEIVNDEIFQSILDGLNASLGDYFDEERPRFQLKEKIITTVENCPPDNKVGDEIEVYCFERPSEPELKMPEVGEKTELPKPTNEDLLKEIAKINTIEGLNEFARDNPDNKEINPAIIERRKEIEKKAPAKTK